LSLYGRSLDKVIPRSREGGLRLAPRGEFHRKKRLPFGCLPNREERAGRAGVGLKKEEEERKVQIEGTNKKYPERVRGKTRGDKRGSRISSSFLL